MSHMCIYITHMIYAPPVHLTQSPHTHLRIEPYRSHHTHTHTHTSHGVPHISTHKCTSDSYLPRTPHTCVYFTYMCTQLTQFPHVHTSHRFLRHLNCTACHIPHMHTSHRCVSTCMHPHPSSPPQRPSHPYALTLPAFLHPHIPQLQSEADVCFLWEIPLGPKEEIPQGPSVVEPLWLLSSGPFLRAVGLCCSHFRGVFQDSGLNSLHELIHTPPELLLCLKFFCVPLWGDPKMLKR